MDNSDLHTEEELLARIAEGDERAFKRMFHDYYPLLSTQVFFITRSFDLTQEIVQDVFLKIWMSREALAGIRDFKGYLWVMAKNHALNALNKIARERTNRITYFSELGSIDKNPEKEENVLFTLLDEAVAGLPPQQQKVFLLSRRDRLKQAQIASQLGLTVSTVKKYLQLAIEFITRYIKDRHASLFPLLLLITFLIKIIDFHIYFLNC